MIEIILVLFAVFLLYVLSTICRKNHPDLPKLRPFYYAHRGLHGNGVPENSMEAFRLAKEAGYGVELDIHLLSDGELAVIHDSTLLRTTGSQGRIEDMTSDALKKLCLEGTDQTIPTFSDVMALFDGAVPMIVELKPVDGNHAALCQKACDMLRSYPGLYCVESFDPRCIMWLRKNRPEIIRGQLTENYFASAKSKLPWFFKFILRNQMMNFLSVPDFVAYRFSDRKTFSNVLVRKLWGGQGVTWTIRSEQDLQAAKQEGWIAIFEGFKP